MESRRERERRRDDKWRKKSRNCKLFLSIFERYNGDRGKFAAMHDRSNGARVKKS